MCSACRLMVLNVCVKFHVICQAVLSYGADTKIVDTQRAITPKEGKPELPFMCSAGCLMVLNICVKFYENMSSCFKVMERTQKLLIKGNNSESRKTRVTIHVFCTSSHGV